MNTNSADRWSLGTTRDCTGRVREVGPLYTDSSEKDAKRMIAKWIYAAVLLLGAIGSQVYAIYLMPMTRGATLFIPTAGVMISFAIFTLLVGRLLVLGFQLILIVPLLSATVPIGGIIVGVLGYGEVASYTKLVTLIVACLLVGIASAL